MKRTSFVIQDRPSADNRIIFMIVQNDDGDKLHQHQCREMLNFPNTTLKSCQAALSLEHTEYIVKRSTANKGVHETCNDDP
jgi:hypothetical protein